jgi:7,8-dihydro-6-hydroxymethylpterin-pyrophosphokinase
MQALLAGNGTDMTQVLVGLGSNQGDSVALVRRALLDLRAFAAGDVRAFRWRATCSPR